MITFTRNKHSIRVTFSISKHLSDAQETAADVGDSVFYFRVYCGPSTVDRIAASIGANAGTERIWGYVNAEDEASARVAIVESLNNVGFSGFRLRDVFAEERINC